jgi:hypothetical protein
MVGLSQGDAAIYGKKLMENKSFQIMNEKLFIKDVKEIPRQNSYFHKMQQLERSRLEKKSIT